MTPSKGYSYEPNPVKRERTLMAPYEMVNYERKRRAFLDAIQPFLKTRARIYSMTLPKIIVYASGEVKTDYQFSGEQQSALAALDELIDACGRSCYGSEWDQVKERK